MNFQFENITEQMADKLELLFLVLFTVIVTIILAWITKSAFRRFIERSSEELKNDPTNYRFMSHMVVVLIYVTGFSFAIYMVPSLRHIAGSLIAGAGILAIAIGFASQQALGNIVSGIFIVIFKPYRLGDRVTMRSDLRGVVEDINLRHTIIRNFENQRIIVPNSIMSSEVLINSNYTDDKICRFIEIGISYGSDMKRAKTIMAEEVLNHPDYLDNRKPEDIESGAVPPVTVRVLSLEESSVLLRAWAWAKDAPTAFTMGCDLVESIKERFDREGIVIPFPQRTISYLDPSRKKSGDAADPEQA